MFASVCGLSVPGRRSVAQAYRESTCQMLLRYYTGHRDASTKASDISNTDSNRFESRNLAEGEYGGVLGRNGKTAHHEVLDVA